MNFTIVLPIKGTKAELPVIRRAIRSCVLLKPGEIIIGVDKPMDNFLAQQLKIAFLENKYEDYKIIEVEKTNEWGFQLAKVVWECYKTAKYDKLFSFDVDSTLRPVILKGYDLIGKNDVACISFTKRMPINSIQKLIRYVSHRWRIRTTKYCFTGCYWIYRPYYFRFIFEDDFKKIKNGVDGILVDKLLEHPTYKLITFKDIGARCYTIGNEDYDWRQFQNGVWFWANKEKFIEQRQKTLDQRKEKMGNSAKEKLQYVTRKKKHNLEQKHYLIFMFGKIILYQYWHMLAGYLWASRHPDAEIVKVARKNELYEFSYLGVKLLPKRKWKDADKTGFNV